MSGLLIGYARVSTDAQDLTAQRDALAALGVPRERHYVDQGLTGTSRNRPGLREALAACRAGDTLVVTKLDRLARSLPDARDMVDDLTRRQVRLNIGGSVHDPSDPVGRLLFNVLAMVAEFEADLIRARTPEGMQVAKFIQSVPSIVTSLSLSRGLSPPESGATEHRRVEVAGARIASEVATGGKSDDAAEGETMPEDLGGPKDTAEGDEPQTA